MSRFLVILMVLIAPAATALASVENEITAQFVSANQAYDRGDYEEALALYRDIARRSPSSLEAWYNAANAAFRDGAIGEAVLYYRRAWFLNPRDADVQANLQLALQRTGARTPSTSLIDRAATELSQQEWSRIFKAGYWLAFALTIPMILLPSARRFIKPWLALALFVSCSGLAGWLYWQQWQNSAESVVTGNRQVARYEPREQATEFFALPDGSIVNREDVFDQWVKVNAGDQSGWVPASSIQHVNTWHVP